MTQANSISKKPTMKRTKKFGAAPGSLMHIGEQKVSETKVSAINYSAEQITVTPDAQLDIAAALKETAGNVWINVAGLHDVQLIEKICASFHIHPLIIEDILDTESRSKLDIFDDYIFLSMKLYSCNEESCAIDADQISLIFGANFVILFQERAYAPFDLIVERLKKANSKMRRAGADYLAHALIDMAVDGYFNLLEIKGQAIEDIEEELLENPTKETLYKIHALKRDMIFLRKSVWPLREILSGLQHGVSNLIQPTTLFYLKDIYDHSVQVVESVEAYRDLIASMIDIYMSSISNRLNEVMKVLTIFASIFIPLTFVCSIYGMNFNPAASPFNMPELNWRYGYPAVIGLMLVMVIGMLIYFKRKKWF